VMVVDEFGGTAGLVTLKDLVAEIIGDNPELESPEEVPIQLVDEQTFLVQAQMDLEEVNELLDLNLPVTDEYQTLAGFLLYQFQKIPLQGEILNYENLELKVISAEGPRLNRIRIHRYEPTTVPVEDLSETDVTSDITSTENTANETQGDTPDTSTNDLE